MSTSQPATLAKGTIYLQSDFGGRIVRIEARDITVKVGRYAQFEAGVHLEFIPKGKRLRRRFVETSKNPSLVIVEGWGHPESPRHETIITDTPEVQTRKSDFLAFDPAWNESFSRHFDAYVAAGGVKVFADYRNHNPHNVFRAGSQA